MNIDLHFIFAVANSFGTPPRSSQDNIYTALRTIDLTDFSEDMSRSPVWSTPTKKELSQSIPYASPSCTRSLQTPTHDQPTTGMI